MLVNLDAVAAMLPQNRVWGVDDAGWIVNMTDFKPSIYPPLLVWR